MKAIRHRKNAGFRKNNDRLLNTRRPLLPTQYHFAKKSSVFTRDCDIEGFTNGEFRLFCTNWSCPVSEFPTRTSDWFKYRKGLRAACGVGNVSGKFLRAREARPRRVRSADAASKLSLRNLRPYDRLAKSLNAGRPAIFSTGSPAPT
jgi:hypothetical protein